MPTHCAAGTGLPSPRPRRYFLEIVAQSAVRGALATIGNLRVHLECLERRVPEDLLYQPDIAIGGLQQRGGGGVPGRVRAAQLAEQREELRVDTHPPAQRRQRA